MLGNSSFGFSGGNTGGGGGGTIGGGGTLNFISKFNPNGTNIGNSKLFDNGVSIGIGTITPDVSAILDLTSSTQGLLTPRMTTVQRNAIGTPATSLLIYNINTSLFNYFDGVIWQSIDSTATSEWLLDGNTNGSVKYIGTNDAFDFPIYTNGTEKARITTTGEFVLGTTNSSGQFIHAERTQNSFTNGFISNYSPTADASAAWVAQSDTVTLIMGASSSVHSLFPNSAVFGAVDSDIFILSGISGTPRNTVFFSGSPANETMRINTAGNVGIGVITPTAKIHVQGIDATTLINQRLEPVAGVTEDTNGATISTINNTITTIQTIAIPLDTVLLIVCNFTSRLTIVSGGGLGIVGDGNGYMRTVKAKNVGGVVTIGAVQSDFTSEDNVAYDVNLTVSGTDVLARVTGDNANTVTWNVITKTYKVS